jgi:hypothetical protein
MNNDDLLKELARIKGKHKRHPHAGRTATGKVWLEPAVLWYVEPEVAVQRLVSLHQRAVGDEVLLPFALALGPRAAKAAYRLSITATLGGLLGSSRSQQVAFHGELMRHQEARGSFDGLEAVLLLTTSACRAVGETGLAAAAVAALKASPPEALGGGCSHTPVVDAETRTAYFVGRRGLLRGLDVVSKHGDRPGFHYGVAFSGGAPAGIDPSRSGADGQVMEGTAKGSSGGGTKTGAVDVCKGVMQAAGSAIGVALAPESAGTSTLLGNLGGRFVGGVVCEPVVTYVGNKVDDATTFVGDLWDAFVGVATASAAPSQDPQSVVFGAIISAGAGEAQPPAEPRPELKDPSGEPAPPDPADAGSPSGGTPSAGKGSSTDDDAGTPSGGTTTHDGGADDPPDDPEPDDDESGGEPEDAEELAPDNPTQGDRDTEPILNLDRARGPGSKDPGRNPDTGESGGGVRVPVDPLWDPRLDQDSFDLRDISDLLIRHPGCVDPLDPEGGDLPVTVPFLDGAKPHAIHTWPTGPGVVGALASTARGGVLLKGVPALTADRRLHKGLAALAPAMSRLTEADVAAVIRG